MSLFNKTKSFIGLDIGTDSVKMVELKSEQGGPTLATYGIAEESIDIVRDTSQESTKRIVQIIEQVKEQSRTSTKLAIAALPTFAVFSSIISLPAMPKKDLAQAVRWEAKKFVPMPLEEMILDWKLLKSIDQLQKERSGQATDKAAEQGSNAPGLTPQDSAADNEQENNAAQDQAEGQAPLSTSSKPQHLRVLITAAPKNLVSRYVDIFKSAGLQLSSLETEAFAVARSLIGKTKTSAMVVDIGSITTDIMIIEDGIPILNRSIDVGGKTLTTAIAQSLHVETARAEQFKRDIGVNQEAGSNIPRVMEQTMQPILQEIKYSYNLYTNQTNQQVEKIILTGGSALLPEMDTYLAQATNINTYIGDPWQRIRYAEELKPVLEEVGTRLAVSIGLAMRPLE